MYSIMYIFKSIIRDLLLYYYYYYTTKVKNHTAFENTMV
jgi:hypothetical protein